MLLFAYFQFIAEESCSSPTHPSLCTLTGIFSESQPNLGDKERSRGVRRRCYNKCWSEVRGGSNCREMHGDTEILMSFRFEFFVADPWTSFPRIPRLAWSHVLGVIYRKPQEIGQLLLWETPSFQAKDALKALKFKLENVAYGGGAQVGIHQLRQRLLKIHAILTDLFSASELVDANIFLNGTWSKIKEGAALQQTMRPGFAEEVRELCEGREWWWCEGPQGKACQFWRQDEYYTLSRVEEIQKPSTRIWIPFQECDKGRVNIGVANGTLIQNMDCW